MSAIDIPPAWERSAERVLENRWRRILIIGATDRGKSTYCSFLSRRLCAAGSKVAFVDADIGQKDVGPPATISLAYLEPESEIKLPQVTAFATYFVGAVTPVRHFVPMIVGSRRLVDAADAPFVIIDTTGLVQGSGRALKAFKIESLRPDVIVAIGKGAELDPIVRAHRHYNVIRLAPSSEVAPKPAGTRRAIRERSFRRYFGNAQQMVIDLERLIFQRSILLNGQRFADKRFIYAESTPEGIIAVSEAPGMEARGMTVIPIGFEKNLLCGLADQHGEGLGLAILDEINFRRATVSLLTPVSATRVRILQFGDLYLRPDGRAVRRKAPIRF